MTEKITTKKLTTNIILSVVAQVISLVTSFVLGLIVPKFIDTTQYSYWQMYVLYVSYVGILHFGLLDGIILRYAQYDYDDLDKRRVRAEFQTVLLFTTVVAVVSCVVAASMLEGEMKWIVALVAIGGITKNLFTYNSYALQMTNRIKYYALIVIMQRLAYAVCILVLIICGVNSFVWYCVADLCGDLAGSFLAVFFNSGMYFGKTISLGEWAKETGQNIFAGFFLMIANFSSMLLVGGAKMVINMRWDEAVFGQVAFGFSVTNLFLSFVSAASVVLFPSLKRMKQEELPALYGKIRSGTSALLFPAMILYFPVCRILELWLPAYADSLVYLGVLFPIIVFSSKVGLLTDNYLKAYRKEKQMLFSNAFSVAIGVGLCLLSAYVFNDIMLVLFSTVFAIVLRAFISETIVSKLIDQKIYKHFFFEVLMSVVFVVATMKFDLWTGCLVYAVALSVYIVFYRKVYRSFFLAILNKCRKK